MVFPRVTMLCLLVPRVALSVRGLVHLNCQASFAIPAHSTHATKHCRRGDRYMYCMLDSIRSRRWLTTLSCIDPPNITLPHAVFAPSSINILLSRCDRRSITNKQQSIGQLSIVNRCFGRLVHGHHPPSNQILLVDGSRFDSVFSFLLRFASYHIKSDIKFRLISITKWGLA